MRKPIKNMGASVRARLLALAKERNQPFDLLLTRYTLERFLYRLSTSDHRNRFVLKGAMLLVAVLDDPFRPTRDLDLLGFGDSTPDELRRHSGISVPWISTTRLSLIPRRSPSIVFAMTLHMAGYASKPMPSSMEHGSASSSISDLVTRSSPACQLNYRSCSTSLRPGSSDTRSKP